MAYLELSMEAYDNVIKAAGIRGGQVAKVCNDQGVWSVEAKAEAPPAEVVEETTPVVSKSVPMYEELKTNDEESGCADPEMHPAQESVAADLMSKMMETD